MQHLWLLEKGKLKQRSDSILSQKECLSLRNPIITNTCKAVGKWEPSCTAGGVQTSTPITEVSAESPQKSEIRSFTQLSYSPLGVVFPESRSRGVPVVRSHQCAERRILLAERSQESCSVSMTRILLSDRLEALPQLFWPEPFDSIWDSKCDSAAPEVLHKCPTQVLPDRCTRTMAQIADTGYNAVLISSK